MALSKSKEKVMNIKPIGIIHTPFKNIEGMNLLKQHMRNYYAMSLHLNGQTQEGLDLIKDSDINLTQPGEVRDRYSKILKYLQEEWNKQVKAEEDRRRKEEAERERLEAEQQKKKEAEEAKKKLEEEQKKAQESKQEVNSGNK